MTGLFFVYTKIEQLYILSKTNMLSYNHLLRRLKEYSTPGTAKYHEHLESLNLIPGINKNDLYRSYFDLCEQYHRSQIKQELLSELMDEAIDLIWEGLTDEQKEIVLKNRP